MVLLLLWNSCGIASIPLYSASNELCIDSRWAKSPCVVVAAADTCWTVSSVPAQCNARSNTFHPPVLVVGEEIASCNHALGNIDLFGYSRGEAGMRADAFCSEISCASTLSPASYWALSCKGWYILSFEAAGLPLVQSPA
jgi:hypothetical protein